MKIVTKDQMNKLDAQAVKTYQIPSILLMEHAAIGIFQKMVKLIDKSQKIQIVCGCGNNGGDGLALARLLQIAGYSVCYSIIEKKPFSCDANINYNMVQAMNICQVDTLQQVDVIVDAIFGTGLNQAVEGVVAEWIKKINEHPAKVFSIDIPSGILADTGECLSIAVKADHTFTLQAPKLGLYVYPGREYANKVTVIDLQLPEDLLNQIMNHPILLDDHLMNSYLPKRNRHSHKGSYGKVLAIGGSQSMSGAICLATRAMFASGCGMVTCAIPKGIQNVVQTNVLEAMTIALDERDGHIAKEAFVQLNDRISMYDGILIGCGLTRSIEIQPIMEALLKSEVPLVVDADALVLLKPLLPSVGSRRHLILTPHLKEFADLMDLPLSKVENQRMQCIDQFCKQYPEITLVLKSETTIVAQGDKRGINIAGNHGLATAGSGDVLAGMITGFLVQGNDAWKASCLGVYLHAKCADQIALQKSMRSIMPTDIITILEQVIFELEETRRLDA
ncbi:MAG: NAD(P)H-hydrate dehydratase [Erysipelotrichaceae bacterium]|nr:NAD(P)H-hydrate dehydratase [Erysipelotrichaceae bacterium]